MLDTSRLTSRSRLTTGHQLRSGASAPHPPEDVSASQPGRFGHPISYVSCMPLLAGPWKPREPPHRRQVCHQLAQGRRPGSTRSGGARKVEDEPRAARWRRIAAQDASTRAPVCRRQPTQPRTPIGWAAVNGYAISCAAPWLNGAPPVPTNQPRDHRANRRPGQRRRLGPGPRKGRRRSTRPTPRPPSDNSARRSRRPTARSRVGTSCRPTLGEPTTLC